MTSWMRNPSRQCIRSPSTALEHSSTLIRGLSPIPNLHWMTSSQRSTSRQWMVNSAGMPVNDNSWFVDSTSNATLPFYPRQQCFIGESSLIPTNVGQWPTRQRHTARCEFASIVSGELQQPKLHVNASSALLSLPPALYILNAPWNLTQSSSSPLNFNVILPSYLSHTWKESCQQLYQYRRVRTVPPMPQKWPKGRRCCTSLVGH